METNTVNTNHRGEEVCSACGFATGHAGYGDDSIGYVDGTIGPLCDSCNARLVTEIEVDSSLNAEIERLRAVVDALPHTADGVPIVPGMLVQVKGYIPFTAEVWGISPSGVVIRRGGGSYIPKELCSVQGARP